MTRMFGDLARDESGASLIEMAMALPVMASLLIGMVDISRAYSTKLQLEQAAQRAIEKVQQYQASSSTYVTLKVEAALAAEVPLDKVTVDYWLECDGTKQATYNTNCPTGQTYARWVTVDVEGTFTPLFASSKWPGSNADGTYTIHGKAGLRTQ